MTKNQQTAAENQARNQRIINREKEIADWVSAQPQQPIDPRVDFSSMYPETNPQNQN